MMTRDLTLKKKEEELNSLLTEDEITLQKLNNLSLYSTTNHHHHGFKKNCHQ